MRVKLIDSGLVLTETTTKHLVKDMIREGLTEDEAINSIRLGRIRTEHNPLVYEVDESELVSELIPQYTFETTILKNIPYQHISHTADYPIIPDSDGVFGYWDEE